LKRVLKRVGISVGVFVGLVLVLLLVSTIVHQISLNVESDRIKPNGQMVNVNGHDIHVYIEGENEAAPLLVFLSGFGTTAPVYDFKPLYSLLSDDYRIAVVERAGYGYSEIVETPRDIDTVLYETRTALSLLGETGPYILFAHSVSGLEALRWAQLYPEEITAIIGIDMAIPSYYLDEKDYFTSQLEMLKTIRILTWMGLHRLPLFAPVSDLALTEEEYEQARLLSYRNTANPTMMMEGEALFDNVLVVEQAGIPNVPMLQLVSNESGELWVIHQKDFAEQSGCQIEFYDAGHYLHQDIPERIATISKEFISSVLQ
jgi:pimeloyl-ACP methyl ester carboxylesterase